MFEGANYSFLLLIFGVWVGTPLKNESFLHQIFKNRDERR